MCPCYEVPQKLSIRLVLQDVWVWSPLADAQDIVLRYVPDFGSIQSSLCIDNTLPYVN